MNFFSFNTDPDCLIPIWSTQNGIDWCSIDGLPLDIPPDVNDYVLKPNHHGFCTKMKQEGAESYAAYFNPHFHWLGWSPTKELLVPPRTGNSPYQDPAGVAFGDGDMDTIEKWVDAPSSGSEMNDPSVTLAGYSLEDSWRRAAIDLSERMLEVSECLARGTDWYGPNSTTDSLGHIPYGVSRRALEAAHDSHSSANCCAAQARAILRSQLGWLAWFTAVLFEWSRGLSVTDKVFINSLRLSERDRRGFLYNLTRDYHDSNFYFLIPEFLSELQEITTRRETDMSSLPSYSLWQEDLDRYDTFFQDTRFGKVGEILTEFRPNWAYYLVEGVHFGARVLDFRHERRVCAECFKGLMKTT
ncbi:hypothetical protein K438DRAFT_1757510 [Mycena galopus ATCC 62051]|nr:hypothetical protein K438DRAFT_1757510 [Mycena galopus ATCC 62051]